MPRVIHFEIHAGDPERAAKFYSELFGWEITKWDGPVDYWLIKTGEDNEPGINGAIMQRQGEIDGKAVIAYACTIDVPDVDEYLERAVKLGAEVTVPKIAVPKVGWMCYCKDTEGNIFGMMQHDVNAA